jgi:hypothetical protein
LAEEANRAGIWLLKSEQQGDGRGFSCAVGSENGEKLALRHFEVKSVERRYDIEAFDYDSSAIGSLFMVYSSFSVRGCALLREAHFD